MNNEIIELKELSRDNAQNSNYIPEHTGDYTCQVGEVTLYKGDQLSLRSAFIDQVGESSDLIEVLSDDPDDTTATITLTFGYYVQDWGGTPTDAIPATNTPEGTTLTRCSFIPADPRAAVAPPTSTINYPEGQPNGQLYIGCNVAFHTGGGQQANLSLLTGFNLFLNDEKSSKDSKQKGIRVGYFKYEDVKSTDAKRIFHSVTIVFNKVDALAEYNSKESKILIENGNANKYIRFGKNDHSGGGPTTTGGFRFPLPMRRGTWQVNYTPYSNKESRRNGTYDHYQRMVLQDGLNLGTLQEDNMTFGGTYTPSTFTQQITIPAKSYEPEDLAMALSAGFSQVDSDPLPNHQIRDNFVSTNKLITTTTNFNTNFVDNPLINNDVPGYGSLTPEQQEQVFGNFVADDGYQIMQIQSVAPNKVNQFLGTTNFDIHYDGSRFSIQQMHTPIFDNNGNNIIKSVQSYQVKGPVGSQIITESMRFANKSSGIFLTDIQPSYLWFNRMKFSTHILASQTGTSTIAVPSIPAGGPNVNAIVPQFELTDGVHITGDIISIGSVQPPPSNNEGVNWQDATNFNNRKMIESQTIPILADLYNNTDNEKEKNGYYQIEIDCGINSIDIRGQDNPNNKIKGIISKYYTDKSYLSSYNEGAIPYIHTSDIPLTLSQFKVRILDSRGELASINNQIGADNTVFMDITRANKNN